MSFIFNQKWKRFFLHLHLELLLLDHYEVKVSISHYREKKITVIGLFFSFFSVKSSPSAIKIFSILVFIFVFIYLYQKLTNIFPNKSILPSSNVYGYDYY